MSYDNKIHISWEEFHKDAKYLCNKIKEKYDISNLKGIVVVTRGGLALASVVTSELNIKNIEAFSMFSYNGGTEESSIINIISYPKKAIEDKGENWLVLDDLLDTGKSAEIIKQYLPNSILVTLYSKIEKHNNLNEYVRFFKPDSWICFPWSVYDF